VTKQFNFVRIDFVTGRTLYKNNRGRLYIHNPRMTRINIYYTCINIEFVPYRGHSELPFLVRVA